MARTAERRTSRRPARARPTPPGGSGLLDGVFRGARRHRGAAGRSTVLSVVLATVCAALIVLGLVMTFSASFVRAAVENGGPFYFFVRQLAFAVCGAVGMVVGARVDYRRWQGVALPLLGLTLLASAAVLIPGIGTQVDGARRWIDLGPLRVQPAEMLKLALPLALAALVAGRWHRIRTGELRALLRPGLPLLALAVLLVGWEDLETALLVGVIGGTVLWVAGLPTQIVVGSGFVSAFLVVREIAGSTFRRGRLGAWLDPASDPVYGYQTLQGFLALGSGGLFGVGLGASRGKWLYVPNAHTDFIFAIIGEELGLVGALLVLAAYAALAVCGVLASARAPDPFGRLLAAAITAWLLLQAGINVGSVVGVLPVTGVTLPLVSFGGSSLVITMAGCGLLIAIARAGRRGDGAGAPGRRPSAMSDVSDVSDAIDAGARR